MNATNSNSNIWKRLLYKLKQPQPFAQHVDATLEDTDPVLNITPYPTYPVALPLY